MAAFEKSASHTDIFVSSICRFLGEIRIVPLNIMTVSLESSLRREIVQDCLRETLLYLLGLIAAEQPVAFVFNSIGILQIHNKNVHMTFFKEFLEAMDGSGKLAKAISIVRWSFFSQHHLFRVGLGEC